MATAMAVSSCADDWRRQRRVPRSRPPSAVGHDGAPRCSCAIPTVATPTSPSCCGTPCPPPRWARACASKSSPACSRASSRFCSAASSVPSSVVVSPAVPPSSVTATTAPVSKSTACSSLCERCVLSSFICRDLRLGVVQIIPIWWGFFFTPSSCASNPCTPRSSRVSVSMPDVLARSVPFFHVHAKSCSAVPGSQGRLVTTPVWTSEHTAMHRPHKMHLFGSRIMEGDVSSKGASFFVRTNRVSLMPRSAAIFCNSQFWLRKHERQSFGWLARINSTFVCLASRMRWEFVKISIPSFTHVTQERIRERAFLTSTMHMAHDAFLETSSQ